MDFPADLPGVLEYRVGSTVRYTFPRRPVLSVGSGGATNAALICPQVPYGATGWRLPTETAWRPLSELPAAWLPFLDRERGSAMDFRS